MKLENYTLKEIAGYWTGKVDANILDETNYVSTENLLSNKGGAVKSNYVLKNGKANSYSNEDVLISNIRPYFKKIWFADKEGGCSNDVLVFRAKDVVEPLYLYYQLSRDSFFDYMVSGSNGTKMPRGNKKSIMEYKIQLPPLSTQRKIIFILSAYDNLIKNNLERIKLLEESIRAHYIILMSEKNGTWIKKRIDEVYDFSNGYAFYKDGYSDEGKIVIDLGNISESSNLIMTGKEKYVSELQYEDKNKFHLDKYDVIVAMTDMTYRLGILAKVGVIDESNKYILNQRVGRLRSKVAFIDHCFLYASLSNDGFRNEMKSKSKGAVQVYFNTKDILDYEVTIPSEKLIKDFSKVISPLIDLRISLNNQNTKLREARDILLPKLINGQIEV